MDFNNQTASKTTEDDSSWCETHVKVVEANFLWTINNFSFCNEKSGEALESTVFSATAYDLLKWRMQFYPSGNNHENKDYVSLFLHLVICDKPTIKADFRFCILDKDGCEVNERKTTDKWQFYQGRQSGFPKFVKKDTILDSSSGLLLNDKLRIVCRIKAATGDVDRTCQDTSIPEAPDLLREMSEDYARLLRAELFSDVSLEAGGGGGGGRAGGAKFPAHKNVLAARSPVFAAMFEHDMRERQESVVKIHDLDAETLGALLGFVYTGRIEAASAAGSAGIAGKLLGAADKYALEGLKSACEHVLSKGMTVQDAAESLLVAELHSAGRLKVKALTFIKAHLKEVMDSPGFKVLADTQPCLMEEILRFMTVQ